MRLSRYPGYLQSSHSFTNNAMHTAGLQSQFFRISRGVEVRVELSYHPAVPSYDNIMEILATRW
jgi:hypothetical protein